MSQIQIKSFKSVPPYSMMGVGEDLMNRICGLQSKKRAFLHNNKLEPQYDYEKGFPVLC